MDEELESRTHNVKLIKVRCRYCGHLNLIPTQSRITIEEPIRCEKCKEVIAKTNKKSKTIFFYGDTVIP